MITDCNVLAAVEPLLGPQLTAEQARQIYEQGPEATVFALLTFAKLIAETQALAHTPAPHAPSGATPAYHKPPASRRSKKPSRKPGHPGSRRPPPTHIDRRVEHVLEQCPRRQGPVLPWRLRRHRQELFTFLEHPEVPFDNNAGERAIRPAVIIRKNSYANGSEAGADLQAVLMGIYRTLKQHGHNALEAIVSAVQTYLKTGQLAPLPARVTAAG